MIVNVKKTGLRVFVFIFSLCTQSIFSTMICDFESGTAGWVFDNSEPNNKFKTDPVQTNMAYSGSGAIKAVGLFSNWGTGFVRKVFSGSGTNLSTYFSVGSTLNARIRVLDDLNGAYLKFGLYSRSGGGWTKCYRDACYEDTVSSGTWYNLSMPITNGVNYADPSQVRDMGVRIEHYNGTNNRAFIIDSIEILGTNSVPGFVKVLKKTNTGINVYLKWQNPGNSDFKGTMVRYSTNQYPASVSAGTLLCIKTNVFGSTNSYTHASGLKSNKNYYYSFFAYTTNGLNANFYYSSTNQTSIAQVYYTYTGPTNLKVYRFTSAQQKIVRLADSETFVSRAVALSWVLPVSNLNLIDYVLYRAAEPLTPANLGTASGVQSFSIPNGSTSSVMDITIPDFNQTYYYALKTIYSSVFESLSDNISTLSYVHDNALGWVLKDQAPNYLWKEAEAHTNMSGAADNNAVSAASGGKIVENFQAGPGNYIDYQINVPADMFNPYMYLRCTTETKTARLSVLIDSVTNISEGYIYPAGLDWYHFSFYNHQLGTGPLFKGVHTLRLQTPTDRSINLDGFFIYDKIYGEFTPDNTLLNGIIKDPPHISIEERVIVIDNTVLAKISQPPYSTAAANNKLITSPVPAAGWEISFQGLNNNTLDKALDLNLTYDKNSIPAGVTENQLAVFFWDGADWHKIGGTPVSSGGSVTVRVTHLGIFALFPSTDETKLFKWSYNPFAPSGTGSFQNTVLSFNLAEKSHVKIHIYDMSGKLVRSLLEQELDTGDVNVEWDGRNDRGKMVSVGVYVYRISGAGSKDNAGTITVLR